MGKVTLVLEDRLEAEFRKQVYARMGMRRGNISKAFAEAVNDWVIKEG